MKEGLKMNNKKKKSKESKYFSPRNYLCALLFLIAIILVIWYICSWYLVKKEEKLMNSYLVTTNTVTYEIDDISEIVPVLGESPSEYFIYISSFFSTCFKKFNLIFLSKSFSTRTCDNCKIGWI